MKMARGKKIALKIVIGSIIAFAVCAVSIVLIVLFFYLKAFRHIAVEGKKAQQRQERLLCETDHQALLEACRELSGRVTAGDLKPAHYRVRMNPHAEASQFPQHILDLEPTYVEIESDGRIRMELCGGFIHFGVIAYPEDFRRQGGSWHREIQLIPGLWYYDDDYIEDSEYKKIIDALIQKGKKAG